MTVKLIVFLLWTAIAGHQDTVRGVEVTNLFPMLDSAGHFVAYDTGKVCLYYQGDLTACRVPVSVRGRNGSTYERYDYFIWHKDSSYGFEYRKDTSVYERMDKTAYLDHDTWITRIYGYHAFQDNVMRLVSSDTAASGDLREVYTGYSKKDTTGKGTIYYTFTRTMSDIPYSMSRELDSIKQMKVTAISVVHHPVFMKEYNMMIQEFTSHNFLRRIEVPEDDEVKRYFSFYRRKTGL